MGQIAYGKEEYRAFRSNLMVGEPGAVDLTFGLKYFFLLLIDLNGERSTG